MSAQRTQWAVGNGFFHSGHLSTKKYLLSYIYDCGSLKANRAALSREIHELASRIESAEMMYVSHFDYDHVSGIPELARSIRIAKFIIPLVPPEERLFLFAENLWGDPTNVGPTDDPFYRDFMVDPEGTLRLISPQAEVTVVAPAQAAQSAGEEVTELVPPTGLEGASDDDDLVLDDHGSHGTVVKVDGAAIWEWFPYVAEQARGVGSEFALELVARKLIRGLSDLHNTSVLSDIVVSRQDELKLAYDAAIARLGSSFTRNVTSLMLYSGPVPTLRYRAYRSGPDPIERPEHGAWDPRPGWLGLGDADLRAAKRVTEVNQVFRLYKSRVGTFAPSHHGSKHDWHRNLLDDFAQSGRRVPTFVFGASGAYGHPHSEVLLDINEFGGTTIIVGRQESSRWTESVKVFVEH